MNFGDIFGNIGNFLGGIFGGQKKKEEDKQQVVVQQPPAPLPRQNQPGSVKLPQSFMPGGNDPTKPPQLGGVDIRQQQQPQAPPKDPGWTPFKNVGDFLGSAGQIAGDVGTGLADRYVSKDIQTGKATPLEFLGGIGKGLGQFGGDTLGIFGDLGSRVSETANSLNPLLSDEDKYRTSLEQQNFRKGLSSIKGTMGHPISESGAIDEIARKVESGTATPEDYTMAALYSAGGASFLPVGRLLGKVGKAKGGVSSQPVKPRQSSKAKVDGPETITRKADDIPATPREPGNPITSSPTTNKAPAITSPAITSPANAPTPTVRPPQAFDTGVGNPAQAPTLGGIKPLKVAAKDTKSVPREAPTNVAQTADQQVAQAQAAIDRAATEAPVQPKPVEIAPPPVESPQIAQARAAAAEKPPVSAEAIAQRAKTQSISKAPTEAIAKDIKAASKNSTEDSLGSVGEQVDDLFGKAETPKPPKPPKTATANKSPTNQLDSYHKQAASELDKVESFFKGDSKAITNFNEKMSYNSLSENVTKKPYTTLEKQALKEMDTLSRDSARLINRGYGLREPIGRRSHYAPTGKAGTIEVPTTKAGLISRDLAFNKERKGTLTSKDFTPENTRQAFMRERVSALGTKEFTPAERAAGRAQQIEKDMRQAYEGGPVNLKSSKVETPVRLSDKELKQISNESKAIAEKEVKHADLQEALDVDMAAGKLTKEQVQKRSSEVVNASNESAKATKRARAKSLVDFDAKVKARSKEIRAELRAIRGNSSGDATTLRTKLHDEKASLLRRYDSTHADAHYIQATPATNVLFQPRGRGADAVQTMSEKATMGAGNKLSTKIANRSYAKNSGGDVLFGNKKLAKEYYAEFRKEGLLKSDTVKNFEFNKEFTKLQTTKAGKFFKGMNTGGTGVTELATRNKAPTIDALRTFIAEGERAGLKGDALKSYVRGQIGSPDYVATNKLLWSYHNQHTGVAAAGRQAAGIEKALSKTRVMSDAIARKLPGLDTAQQATFSKGIDILFTGFARAAYRVTRQAVRRNLLGTSSFVKAGRIKGVSQADNFERALLIRQGVTDAAAGGTVAAGATSFGVALGADGRVSGAYPDDPAKRRRWEKEGKTPFSIKVGSGKDATWINFARYLPTLYLPVMIGGLIANSKAQDIPLMTLEVAKGVYANTGIDGVVGTFVNLASTLQGDPNSNSWKRLAASVATLSTPFSGIVTTVSRGTDDTKRSTYGDNWFEELGKTLQKKIPGFRNLLDPRTDSFGNPVKNDQASSLFYASSGSEDTPVTAELSRLASAGIEAYPQGTQGNSRNYNSLKDINGDKIDLDTKQQGSLNNAVRKEKEGQAKIVIGSPEYKSASDAEKGAMLKKLYTLDSSAAASTWASSNNIDSAKFTDENINNTLPAESQQALMSYKLQGDKKDVWLENNDNAASYYNAKFANDKANGTLTYKDRDIKKTGSLAQEVAIAGVNKAKNVGQDVIRSYDNINKTEFNALVKAGDKQAKILAAYDKALFDAGLPSKYQNKYGGYGSTSGSGKKGFAFASLPSSLIGTGSTGSGKGSYADNAPLFKPIADLQAPKSVAIPTGRSISVKRGVKL